MSSKAVGGLSFIQKISVSLDQISVDGRGREISRENVVEGCTWNGSLRYSRGYWRPEISFRMLTKKCLSSMKLIASLTIEDRKLLI